VPKVEASRIPGTEPEEMTTYVYLSNPPRKPTDDEQERIDRFLAAFIAKKGCPPAGHWRVPRVGYCVFLGHRMPHLEGEDGPRPWSGL
jgi:hypothetical protein